MKNFQAFRGAIYWDQDETTRRNEINCVDQDDKINVKLGEKK